MIIENFKLINRTGENALDWKFLATVDVITKKGFFRRREVKKQKEIFKNYAGCWYFLDSGEYTPMDYVEKLVRSFEAKNGKDLELCDICKE